MCPVGGAAGVAGSGASGCCPGAGGPAPASQRCLSGGSACDNHAAASPKPVDENNNHEPQPFTTPHICKVTRPTC